MLDHLAPAIYGLLLWWFSTGAILVALGLPRSLHGLMVWGTLPLLVLGGWGVVESAHAETLYGAYLGFTAAILCWGWHELAFLAGVITGPNRAPAPPGLAPGRRFAAAFGAIAWHEIALAATLLALMAATWGAPNPTGWMTFAVLFVARISAKLNVFLGVPNLTEEFLPDRLQHLKSHFRKRPMNLLFPVSVTGLTVAVGAFAALVFHASEPWEAAGYALLAVLTGLALLEHWLLVLPVADAKLWRWMLAAGDPRRRAGDEPRPSDPLTTRARPRPGPA